MTFFSLYVFRYQLFCILINYFYLSELYYVSCRYLKTIQDFFQEKYFCTNRLRQIQIYIYFFILLVVACTDSIRACRFVVLKRTFPRSKELTNYCLYREQLFVDLKRIRLRSGINAESSLSALVEFSRFLSAEKQLLSDSITLWDKRQVNPAGQYCRQLGK